jgi:hypothetical protein
VNIHEDFTRSLAEKTPSDRSFGWVFSGFFALIALAPFLRGRPLRLWALGVSGALLLITLVRPTLFSEVNRLWMRLALLLSRIMNPLVTGLLFFVVITPIALFLRMLGKDSLRLKTSHGSSYWIIRNPPGPEPDTMTHQF